MNCYIVVSSHLSGRCRTGDEDDHPDPPSFETKTRLRPVRWSLFPGPNARRMGPGILAQCRHAIKGLRTPLSLTPDKLGSLSLIPPVPPAAGLDTELSSSSTSPADLSVVYC